MRSLRNFMNLKKMLAAIVAVGITTCLLSESAWAGLAKASGSASNTSVFNFDLDATVEDEAKTDDSKGVFLGAIQNFNVTRGFTNSQICGQDPCPPGTLTVSKLTTDVSGKISGTRFSLRELQTLLNSRFNSNSINLSGDVLRFDVTFDGTSPEPELIWFIQSNLINNLSSLIQPNITGQGMFLSDITVFETGGVNNGGVFSITLQPSFKQVLEPTNRASLIGVGALGAVLLLRRNTRLNKTV